MLCEDGDQDDGNGLSLLGLLPNGQSFEFARNIVNIEPGDAAALAAAGHNPDAIGTGYFGDNEFAGATFSSNGQWLFVNVQTTRYHFCDHRSVGQESVWWAWTRLVVGRACA
jgi:hypothetical protein